jgi:hypothetical protein
MIETARKRNADHVASGVASFQTASLEDAELGEARFDKKAIRFRSRKSPGCSNKAPGTPPGASRTVTFYLQNAHFHE